MIRHKLNKNPKVYPLARGTWQQSGARLFIDFALLPLPMENVGEVFPSSAPADIPACFHASFIEPQHPFPS
jgi:hypothetical protein